MPNLRCVCARITEKDKNHNRHDASQTTTGPREQPQRQQSVVRMAAAAIAVPALAALAIVFVLAAGNNTEQAFAPPPAPCAECGTVINGTGEGTITIPENKKAEIPVPTCEACDAQISFEAFEDDLKGTSGTITITYIDENGVEQVIQGDVDRLKVTNGGSQFVLRGDLFIPGWDPNGIDYTLQGQIDQDSVGITTLQLKAEQGVTGTFESQDTQVSIIGPDEPA
jgi:hypothetical protein